MAPAFENIFAALACLMMSGVVVILWAFIIHQAVEWIKENWL